MAKYIKTEEGYKLASDFIGSGGGIKEIESVNDITDVGIYKTDKEVYSASYDKIESYVPVAKGLTTKVGFKIETYPSSSTSNYIQLRDSKLGTAWIEVDANGIYITGTTTYNDEDMHYSVSSNSEITLDSTPVDVDGVIYPSLKSLGIIYFEVIDITMETDAVVHMYATSTYSDSLTINEIRGGMGIEGDNYNSEIFNDHSEGAAFGSYAHSEGRTTQAGARAFRVQSIDYSTRTFTLDSTSGLKKDMYWSAQIYNGATALNVNRYSKIESISGNTVTVVSMPDNFNTTIVPIDEVLDGFDNENNIFFTPDNPKLGTRNIGSAAHSEGRNTVAARKNAHAEGNKSKALGHSSHAENTSTVYGTYAHGEGSSYVYGNYAHGEGVDTYAVGEASHAQGRKNIAYSYDCYAGGGSSVGYTHLLNKGLNPTDKDSWTQLWTNEERDSLELFNAAVGNNSFTQGSNNLVTGLRGSALGKQNHVSGQDAVAVGSYNTAAGMHSGAFGYSNEVNTGESFVIGHSNIVKSPYRSIAIGNGNELVSATTEGTIILGRYGSDVEHPEAIFLIGNGTASKKSSIFGITSNNGLFHGPATIVTGQYSGALGYTNNVTGAQAFAIGHTNIVDQHKGIALGLGNTLSNVAGDVSRAVVGYYNDDTNKPLFAVGNGTITKDKETGEITKYNRSNALELTTAGELKISRLNSGTHSTNTVSGTGVGVIGAKNNVSKNYSTAIGYNNKITAGDTHFVVGHTNQIVAGYKHVALGLGNKIGNKGAGVQGRVAVGHWNDDTNQPIFAVGNGTGTIDVNGEITSENRSNAFAVFDDGTIKAHKNATVDLEITYTDGTKSTYHLVKSEV